MGFNIRGRRAIVTGGARGIGKEIAREFLREGARVCIADILLDEAQKTVEEFQQDFKLDPNQVVAAACDVTNRDHWQAMWDDAVEKLDGPIDLVCNNAGVISQDKFDVCLRVNGCGTALGIEFAMKKMARSQGGSGGRIINIASAAGLSVFSTRVKSSFYFASKYAVVAMTRAFRFLREDGFDNQGVKCYAVAPWFARTVLGRAGIKGFINSKSNQDKELEHIERKITFGVLEPQDVSKAVMQSLEFDRNGAVWLQVPDSCLIEYPMVDNFVMYSSIYVAKWSKKWLGLEHLRPWHLLLVFLAVMFLAFLLIQMLFSQILDCIF